MSQYAPFRMKNDNMKKLAEMMAAASMAQAGNLMEQIARMLLVMDERKHEPRTHDDEGGQVYARSFQLAKRYGYTDEGIKRFLCKAEESGRVRMMRLQDKCGKGGKLYHIDDFEEFFAPLR